MRIWLDINGLQRDSFVLPRGATIVTWLYFGDPIVNIDWHLSTGIFVF